MPENSEGNECEWNDCAANYEKHHKNLGMAFVEFQNGYDMAPHSWIFKCLQMLDSKKIHKLMSCRPACLIGRSNCLLKIIMLNQCPWREVFFWKMYSTLLFLNPFSMVLRMLESEYRLAKGKPEIAVSHLLVKDELRLRFTFSHFICVVPAMKKGRTWTASWSLNKKHDRSLHR